MSAQAMRECSICYDELTARNVAIPPCGHPFCFNCMMKHTERSGNCPCCRANLFGEDEVIDLEHTDDEEDNDDDETIEGEDATEEEEIEEYAIEELVAEFEAKGYGLKDALSILFENYSRTDPKYTPEYIDQLNADIDAIDEKLQNDFEERRRQAAAAEVVDLTGNGEVVDLTGDETPSCR